jgi:predicted nucleotidyltransferase
MSPEQAVAAIASALHGVEGVRFALLFGSVARGQATASSDVDIAVSAEPCVDLLALSGQLSLALGAEAHVVSLKDPTIPLQQELIRDSIVAYEGKPGSAAIWRSHTLLDLEIDGPWYARMRDAWLKRVATQGLGSGARKGRDG